MDPELPFRLTLLAILVIASPITGYYRVKAFKAGGKVSRDAEPPAIRWTLNLSGFAFGVVFCLYLVDPDLVAWGRFPLPTEVRWAAAGIGVTSIPALWWILSNLSTNITRTVVARENAYLVTTGPYRFVRHPLYSFMLVSWIGLCVMIANLVMAAILVGVFSAIYLRTRIEEEHLIAKFGDEYRSYMERTGRFFPKI